MLETYPQLAAALAEHGCTLLQLNQITGGMVLRMRLPGAGERIARMPVAAADTLEEMDTRLAGRVQAFMRTQQVAVPA